MARSSTSFGKGNQAATKHGVYSAMSRLKQQNELMADYRQRLREGRLTPLEETAALLLEHAKRRWMEATAIVDANGAYTPTGRVKTVAALEDKLRRSVDLHLNTLWRMLSAGTMEPDVSPLEAQLSQYRTPVVAPTPAPSPVTTAASTGSTPASPMLPFAT